MNFAEASDDFGRQAAVAANSDEVAPGFHFPVRQFSACEAVGEWDGRHCEWGGGLKSALLQSEGFVGDGEVVGFAVGARDGEGAVGGEGGGEFGGGGTAFGPEDGVDREFGG